MRGYKLTAAIFTIIQGVLGTLGGLAMIILGIVMMASRTTEGAWAELANALGTFFGAIFLFLGIVTMGFSILFLVLGIKFTSHKPNKGIAITLLVFYSLFAFSGLIMLFAEPISGIFSLLIYVLCIVMISLYLAALAKGRQTQPGVQQSQPTQQPQMNFDPHTGQPLK